MRVLLVSTWNTACGIAEHSALLKENVEAADPGIQLEPCPGYLDAEQALLTLDSVSRPGDVVHLNYQAALHSRWTADEIRRVRATGRPVLVTYHDTGVPNSDQCKAICAAADYYVIHEPFDDLSGQGEYMRQGVPEAEYQVYFDMVAAGMRREKLWWPGQPVVGTVGFPFPWKNYDLLCESAALAGWGVLLLAPTATPEQVARWQQLNPATAVITEFTDRRRVVSYLTGCDATAFLYNCANTGTSGAIRQGIAARKPVVAFAPTICRQFRDLFGEGAIQWVEHGAPIDVAWELEHLRPTRYGVVRLAQQDSWKGVGQAYARIYRALENA